MCRCLNILMKTFVRTTRWFLSGGKMRIIYIGMTFNISKQNRWIIKSKPFVILPKDCVKLAFFRCSVSLFVWFSVFSGRKLIVMWGVVAPRVGLHRFSTFETRLFFHPSNMKAKKEIWKRNVGVIMKGFISKTRTRRLMQSRYHSPQFETY